MGNLSELFGRAKKNRSPWKHLIVRNTPPFTSQAETDFDDSRFRVKISKKKTSLSQWTLKKKKNLIFPTKYGISKNSKG